MKPIIRIPNENVYNIFLTLILGLSVIFFIYNTVPLNHASIYLKKK